MNFENFLESENQHSSSQRYKHEKKRFRQKHNNEEYDLKRYLAKLKTNKKNRRLLYITLIALLLLISFVSILIWPLVAKWFGPTIENGGQSLIEYIRSFMN